MNFLRKKYPKIDNWNVLRADIIIRDNFTCQMCKKYFGNFLYTLNVHHIVSKKYGGDDDPRNLITLCEHCHDIAEEKELSFKQIKEYYKKFMNIIKIKRPPRIAYLWREW